MVVTGATLTGGATGTMAFVSQPESAAAIEMAPAVPAANPRYEASRPRGLSPLDHLAWTALSEQAAEDTVRPRNVRWRLI